MQGQYKSRAREFAKRVFVSSGVLPLDHISEETTGVEPVIPDLMVNVGFAGEDAPSRVPLLCRQ